MKTMENGYCTICGNEISFNLEKPTCDLCDGPCSASNRFSGDQPLITYCHKCGAQEFPAFGVFLCKKCENT